MDFVAALAGVVVAGAEIDLGCMLLGGFFFFLEIIGGIERGSHPAGSTFLEGVRGAGVHSLHDFVPGDWLEAVGEGSGSWEGRCCGREGCEDCCEILHSDWNGLGLLLCVQFELSFFDGDRATYRGLLIVEGRDFLRSYKAIIAFLNKAHMDAFSLELITGSNKQ